MLGQVKGQVKVLVKVLHDLSLLRHILLTTARRLLVSTVLSLQHHIPRTHHRDHRLNSLTTINILEFKLTDQEAHLGSNLKWVAPGQFLRHTRQEIYSPSRPSNNRRVAESFLPVPAHIASQALVLQVALLTIMLRLDL